MAVLCLFLMPTCTTYADVSVEGGLTYERCALPGESYQEVLTLRNQADGPREVKIYQNDYRFDHEGRTSYDEPGTIARSNSSWITMSQSRITVPPKDKAPVYCTVKVPADETLKGTYWSLLMVEEIPQESPEASGVSQKRQPSIGIVQVMRYAVQVITHIGDTGTKELKFLKTAIAREGEKRILQVDVENTGERLLRPQVFTELFTGDGASYGRFTGEKFRLYPTTSRRFSIDVTRAPAGTYKAVVIADCGENDLFGITYTLVFER
jgi:hypothetical protein